MQYQFDLAALFPYWGDFLSGALVTIEITVFSVIIGLVCAIARRSNIGPLRALVSIYVETVHFLRPLLGRQDLARPVGEDQLRQQGVARHLSPVPQCRTA